MDYTHEEFGALAAEVDRQGGVLLPEECAPTQIKYKLGNKSSTTNTCHCGNESMFVTVYEPTATVEKKEARKRGGGFARACAVCDDMGAWPRYAAAIKEEV